MNKFPPRMIPDDDFFRAVWRAQVSIPDVADVYGVSRAAVYRAAHRFNLIVREVEQKETKPEDPPPDFHQALIWSGGKWSDLYRVAQMFGLTSTQAQVAYHKARAIENSD